MFARLKILSVNGINKPKLYIWVFLISTGLCWLPVAAAVYGVRHLLTRYCHNSLGKKKIGSQSSIDSGYNEIEGEDSEKSDSKSIWDEENHVMEYEDLL